MKVNYVVSLGGACEVAYNLRRHFNFEMAFPFDWWITNLRGVIDALDPENDPYADLICSRVGSDVVSSNVHTKDNNIDIHHEFLGDWREQVGVARDRFQYLRTRLLTLNSASSTILFVRHKGDATAAENPATIDSLIDCVSNCFTQSSNKFLLLNTPKPKKMPENIIMRSVDHIDGQWRENQWTGNSTAWDAALDGFDLDNPTLPPFSSKIEWTGW